MFIGKRNTFHSEHNSKHSQKLTQAQENVPKHTCVNTHMHTCCHACLHLYVHTHNQINTLTYTHRNRPLLSCDKEIMSQCCLWQKRFTRALVFPFAAPFHFISSFEKMGGINSCMPRGYGKWEAILKALSLLFTHGCLISGFMCCVHEFDQGEDPES